MIARRSPGWSAATAGASASRSASTATGPRWRPSSPAHTRRATIVNTDEWQAYAHLPETGRPHRTVCHAPGIREWARDDDGDGVREVHCNTMEGVWTGCRNFLRPFRGVSKWYLSQYVAVFEWGHNLKDGDRRLPPRHDAPLHP